MAEEETPRISRERSPIRIADWHVDPATGKIQRGGETVKLAPKVMDVLLYLCDRSGKVVKREEIEAVVWEGVVVSYDTLTGVMKSLRKAFKDDRRNPRIIETIPKKGYRLVAPVQPADPPVPAERTPLGDPAVTGLPRRRQRRMLIGVIAVLLATIGVLLFWSKTSQTTDLLTDGKSARVSIAVLPFDNLGGDAEQEYLADGITDDLITDLTQISELFVIARDSSFAYKGGSKKISEIARDLNVRYLLHGSIRKLDEHIRINAQLTDSTTGKQVWADRYDGEMQHFSRLQDEITQKIVSALAIKLTTADRLYLARQDTDNLKAYEYFLQGEKLFFRYAKAQNHEARALFQKAIALDDDFARAHAMLAWTHTFDFMNGWSETPEQSLSQGEAIAGRAIELETTLPLAYFVRGLVYRERGEYVKALVEAEKSVALDPNYANGHVLHATLLYYAGRPEQGLAEMKKAMQLNPHHPSNYLFHLGQAYFVMRQYPEAIAAFKKGLESNSDSERLHVWLAAAYAQAGDIKDARWEIDQVLYVNPEFSLEKIKRSFPFKEPADLEHFMSGLRKAGLSTL